MAKPALNSSVFAGAIAAIAALFLWFGKTEVGCVYLTSGFVLLAIVSSTIQFVRTRDSFALTQLISCTE